MQNALHFVCPYKCCCLQAEITNMMLFRILFLYRHKYRYSTISLKYRDIFVKLYRLPLIQLMFQYFLLYLVYWCTCRSCLHVFPGPLTFLISCPHTYLPLLFEPVHIALCSLVLCMIAFVSPCVWIASPAIFSYRPSWPV